ncbi:MAG: hypothetical protein MJ108_02565 [Saccharofermentans sp.]|nr:hypothetical protein [Saccharofermentans sp.]
MLIAQSLLNLCLAFTIFSYIEKNINNRRDRILSSAIATYSLIVLSSCPFNLSNGIFDLTVDLLLCNIAIAAFSILIYYKDTPLKASILLCPVLSFLGCVKNSGLFLMLMIICLFIYFTNKQTKSLKLHIYTLISILIVPMLFRVLWEIHIKLSYPPTQAIDTINNTEYSTHPLSIQYYLHIISDKSKEDYSQTIINFFKYIFSFQNNVIFLGMIFIIILFYFSHNKISSPTTNVLTTFSVIVYFCYEIGVLLTFMFSLRKEESAWTVDYSRYSMTIEKFIFGVIIYIIITNISTLHLLSKNTNRFGIALPLFATLLILGFGATSVVSYFQHISMKNFVVIKDSLEKTIEVNSEIGTDSSKSYVVYYSEFNDHEYYRKHLSRYVLYSSEIKFISSEDIEKYSIKDFQQYDYLIVWQDDSSIEQFFTDNDISFNKVLDLKNVG